MKDSFEILKTFIPNLVKAYDANRLNQLSNTQTKLNSIFSHIRSIHSKQIEYTQTHAPNFNIFDVIRYGHYETRLHTPFLVYLLSPTEGHQLGKLFFCRFIESICQFQFDINEPTEIEVIEEYSIGDLGRIDIYLRFKHKGEYYFVAVENKINASDQPKQLERYYEFLMTQTKAEHNIKLIYLTKRGTLPSIPDSIQQSVFDRLTENRTLQLSSYTKDIKGIINQIRLEKIPQNLDAILAQYLNTINNF